MTLAFTFGCGVGGELAGVGGGGAGSGVLTFGGLPLFFGAGPAGGCGSSCDSGTCASGTCASGTCANGSSSSTGTSII